MDETLIHYFGGIKFKVIIGTKSDWYGIKIYVVTDAETAFVLKLLIYTGKYTYANNYNTEILNTVKVVCKLCNTFEESHHPVLIDRFYTSITLMEESLKYHFI